MSMSLLCSWFFFGVVYWPRWLESEKNKRYWYGEEEGDEKVRVVLEETDVEIENENINVKHLNSHVMLVIVMFFETYTGDF